MTETLFRPLTPEEMEDIRRAARAEDQIVPNFLRGMRRIALSLPFAEDLTAAFHCALDPQTPTRVKLTLFGALAYFLTPVDALPDFMPLIGFTDDVAVIGAALAAVAASMTQEHRDKARATLAQLRRI